MTTRRALSFLFMLAGGAAGCDASEDEAGPAAEQESRPSEADARYLPATLDELFADCAVEAWPGTGLFHGVCGKLNVTGGSTMLLDTDVADEPLGPAGLERIALNRACFEPTTVTHGSLWHGGGWPLVIGVQPGAPGRTAGKAVAELPAPAGGLRRLTCCDPLGRCDAILERAASRAYVETASSAPTAPEFRSPARQELEGTLSGCAILAPVNQALIAKCRELGVTLAWSISPHADFGYGPFTREEQLHALTELSPKDASLSPGAFAWQGQDLVALRGTEADSGGEARRVVAVAAPRNRRWLDIFVCHESSGDCDALLRGALEERPPYAGLEDGSRFMVRRSDLTLWTAGGLGTLLGAMNLGALVLLVWGLRTSLSCRLEACGRLARRIPWLIVASLLLVALGLGGYAAVLERALGGRAAQTEYWLSVLASLSVLTAVGLVLPLLAAFLLGRRAKRLRRSRS